MDIKTLSEKSIDEKLVEYKDLFSFFVDPMDKFAQIIDMGKSAQGLAEDDKNESTKISGCTSQAWVKCSKNIDETFSIQTDSDAFIVKGLLYILESVCTHRTMAEIESIEASHILENIGLNRSITSQRTNGFISAIGKIKTDVRKIANAK
jgi:cysteine desulfuration protein SufE